MSVILSSKRGCVGREIRANGAPAVVPPSPGLILDSRRAARDLRKQYPILSLGSQSTWSWILFSASNTTSSTSILTPPSTACLPPVTDDEQRRPSTRAKAWSLNSRRSFTTLPTLRFPLLRVHACLPSARLVLHDNTRIPSCTRSPTSPARHAMAGRR
jgi:hypothetical protein